MGWLRLDDDYASDGTLRRCKAVQWWPLILCAMKRGGGVASDDDIAPDVLADIGQGDEDSAARAIERLKGAGKIVAVSGGWTTPGWSEFQPDPTASDRARRYRERNKSASDAASSRCVTVTSRDETVRHGDVTVQNGSSRLTGQDRTGQDRTGQAEVVDTTSRTRVDSSPAPMMMAPIEAAANIGIADVSEAFRRTQSGRQSMMLAPATVAVLAEMVKAHGPPIVIEAIRRAAERIQGDLTIAYLRPVVASVAAGEPERRPKHGEPGKYQSAAYKSANGVATPRRVPDGEL